MDKFNKSHSDGTYLLMRAEHLAIVAVCVAIAVWHFQEINLWRFCIAFIAIDAIGYIPGLISYLQRKKTIISPIYHYLYNAMHSYLTWGVVVIVWCYFLGWRFEWAMLALPIHLSGDRGVFGNVFKPVGRSFEPVQSFERER
jgi:hypothetical protein